MSKNNDGKKTPILTHLVAGGAAGFMEACTCHPLDTIKVRMQLARKAQVSASVSHLLYKFSNVISNILYRVDALVS